MTRRLLMKRVWLMLLTLAAFLMSTAYAKNSPAITAAKAIMMKQATTFCLEYDAALQYGTPIEDVAFKCDLEKQYEAYQKEMLREAKRLAGKNCSYGSRQYFRDSAEQNFSMPYDAHNIGYWVKNYVYRKSMVRKAVQHAKTPDSSAKEIEKALREAIEDYIEEQD